MYCRKESLKETETGIQNHIKESLYGYSKVVKRYIISCLIEKHKYYDSILPKVLFTLCHIFYEKHIINI